MADFHPLTPRDFDESKMGSLTELRLFGVDPAHVTTYPGRVATAFRRLPEPLLVRLGEFPGRVPNPTRRALQFQPERPWAPRLLESGSGWRCCACARCNACVRLSH